MCTEIISFNAELSPPIYGLPATMQRIIREVSERRQAAIDFALGPALGAASIAIGSRILLNAYGYNNRLNLWIMMIGRSTANKTAPMKDICIYDSEPYINDSAEPFRIIDAATNPKPNPTKTTVAMRQRTWDERPEATLDKVTRLTEEVVRRGIDLTEGYSKWVEIGMALANLGDTGREFFHAVSSVYPGYDRAKADTKFTNLLRTTRKVTIATFFHQCEAHGITLDRAD